MLWARFSFQLLIFFIFPFRAQSVIVYKLQTVLQKSFLCSFVSLMIKQQYTSLRSLFCKFTKEWPPNLQELQLAACVWGQSKLNQMNRVGCSNRWRSQQPFSADDPIPGLQCTFSTCKPTASAYKIWHALCWQNICKTFLRSNDPSLHVMCIT